MSRLLIPSTTCMVFLLPGGCCLMNQGQLQRHLDAYGNGKSFYEYPSLITKLRTTPDDVTRGRWLYAGTCNRGKLRFVVRADGYTSEYLFFDPETDEFIAITSRVDTMTLRCHGRHYWPRRVRGSNGVVTEVIRGTQVKVGDRLRRF